MKTKNTAWFLLIVTTAAIAAGSYGDFLGVLAQRESSGNQYAVNRYGYAGLYQMGTPALIDAGYKNKDGSWTGKNGINNQTDFLANANAQTDAVTTYQSGIQKYIKQNGLDQYVGQTIGGVQITESGLIAGAHLTGQGNLKAFLTSGGSVVPRDGNNIPITEYISKFGGYNGPEAGAVANLAASVVGNLEKAFGLTPTYGVGLGQDVGNPGTVCTTDYFLAPACYIVDPCNLACVGAKGNDATVGSNPNMDGGFYDP